MYMNVFLQNLSLRDSCYNCSFKKKYRESDITLGDYWGINNVHKNMNDDKGISLLVIHSNKGKELFELIKDNLIYEVTNLDKAVSYNSSMVQSSKKNINRDNFMNELDNTEFDVLANKYVHKVSFIKKVIRKLKNTIRKLKNK